MDEQQLTPEQAKEVLLFQIISICYALLSNNPRHGRKSWGRLFVFRCMTKGSHGLHPKDSTRSTTCHLCGKGRSRRVFRHFVAKICGSVVGGPSCTSDGDCASGTCAGADYGSGSVIPSSKDILKTESSAIGIASKAGAAVAKCVDKAVAAEVKLPGSSNAQLCINNAKLKGLESINKLAEKTGGTPSCLLGTGQSNLIIQTTNLLADAILSIGDVIYCN